MTNGEKYKTTEEREKAYREFCESRKSCSGCPANTRPPRGESDLGFDRCPLIWITLEAENAKPKEPAKGPELKPCPFCGSEAEIAFAPIGAPIGEKPALVSCTKCHAEVFVNRREIQSTRTIEELVKLAMTKWNRRARL